MIEAFDRLWEQARPAFAQQRTWQRARTLALGALVGLGRRTVSGLLSATAQQATDWTAAYRLFNRRRFDAGLLWAPARRAVLDSLGEEQPFVALMDDTLLHKRGRKVKGASWRRDPLGPPFCNNFVWGQRFLQLSAALPEASGSARAIPIDMRHCPSPRKPRKNAAPERWEHYRRQCEASKISTRGAEAIGTLRRAMDHDGQQRRELVVSVDGGYTNTAVIKALSERTTLIGRLRKDARLYGPPTEEPLVRRGRKRLYGEPLPTPDHLRQDATVPWQTVRAHAAGRDFDFDVKSVGPVRWRGAGQRDLRLVIVRALAYRPRKGAKLLYRNPAYLICTDPDFNLQQLVQAYLWRWEIEVNFRDQKTLLGTGQAQVRTWRSVEALPVLIATAYAYLHLALAACGLNRQEAGLARPKWQRPQTNGRLSTARGLNLLRFQLWGQAVGVENFTHVRPPRHAQTKSDKFISSPASAIFYAST